jgi:homoserine O-acetyltransferase
VTAASARIRHLVTPRFTLESGEILKDLRQAYVLEGELNARRDNLVLVFHSLTGSPETLGAWKGSVIGPGMAIDTDRWAVLCPNLLGSCYGTEFRRFLRRGGRAGAQPTITTRDQAAFAEVLLSELHVERVALVTGGSLGGMVALEFVASFPSRARAAVVFAAPAAHTAWAIGWNHVQRQAIRSAGPAAGLAVARMAAMLTYRSPAGLESRFARLPGEGETFAIQAWLDHHGDRLVKRFDADSYLALLGAMDAHDVGRGRGGIGAALAAFRGRLVAVGITDDALYPDEEVRRWARAARAESLTLVSEHGHDAFLLEAEHAGSVLRGALEAPSALSRRAEEAEGARASSSSAAAP